MKKQATAEDVVAHLTDERMLHSYCTFNTTYRPLIATVLFGQLTADEPRRRASGEISDAP